MQMNVADIERSIKRILSNAEKAAIAKIIDHLPTDGRKRKRMIRVARDPAIQTSLAELWNKFANRLSGIHMVTDRKLFG